MAHLILPHGASNTLDVQRIFLPTEGDVHVGVLG
jgi:hypothetical protein